MSGEYDININSYFLCDEFICNFRTYLHILVICIILYVIAYIYQYYQQKTNYFKMRDAEINVMKSQEDILRAVTSTHETGLISETQKHGFGHK